MEGVEVEMGSLELVFMFIVIITIIMILMVIMVKKVGQMARWLNGGTI